MIIDRATHYMWVFLSPRSNLLSTSFHVFLLNMATKLLTIALFKWIRVVSLHDLMLPTSDAGFILESTAADAPFQNGMAEHPNQSLGHMMCCLLQSADLDPEYWFFALLHAVYLKNYLCHTSIKDTPFHAYTGQKPSGKCLHIFGCQIVVQLPG